MKTVRKIVTLLFATGTASTMAQNDAATIFYTPVAVIPPIPPAAAVAVPTASSIAMIALGVLLAVVALQAMRKRSTAAKVFSVLLLVGTAVSITTGVEQALATSGLVISGEQCNGGQQDFSPQLSGSPLTNSCDVDITVDSYTSNCDFLDETECPTGTMLAAGSSCSLPFCSNPPG